MKIYREGARAKKELHRHVTLLGEGTKFRKEGDSIVFQVLYEPSQGYASLYTAVLTPEDVRIINTLANKPRPKSSALLPASVRHPYAYISQENE